MTAKALKKILAAASKEVKSWPKWMQRQEYRYKGGR